jgi:hypothetical protein
MARLTPREMLDQGRAILDPVLEPLGYVFAHVAAGGGSGGSYAVGRYTTPDRAVELHCRHALGIVRYGAGGDEVDHRDWVAFVGGRSSYPGFSDDPLAGFEHLREDLTGVCAPLVRGECDDQLHECAERLRADPAALRPRRLP